MKSDFVNSVVSSDGDMAKYMFCSFDSMKCGSRSRKLNIDFSLQEVWTSLAFGEVDTCVYELASLVDFPIDIDV